MKLIIFQREASLSSIFGYRTSVKIAYLLKTNVVLAGICEQEYCLPDIVRGYTWEKKADLMLTYELGEVLDDRILNFKAIIDLLAKMKKRSGKDIVLMEQMKKGITMMFDCYSMPLYEKNFFGLKTMKELLSPDDFYFYHLSPIDAIDPNAQVISPISLMQLQLPDTEKGAPLFFININTEYDYLMHIDIFKPHTQSAEDQNCFYGEECFIFPLMDTLSTNEIKLARLHLESHSADFIPKIEQWASICYANPNSNVGLEHFRENLQGFLPRLKEVANKSPILKNVCALACNRNKSRIIVAEAPIHKIWEFYKTAEAITVAEYDQLMEIKTQQFPKYEGRWPVLLFDRVVDLLAEEVDAVITEINYDQNKSAGVSKRIAVD